MADDSDPDAFWRKLEREHYDEFTKKEKAPLGGDSRKTDGAWKDEEQPLETISAASWHDLPIPETSWLDSRNLIPMESSSFFVGATKVGKTFQALQASIACVAGTRWNNEPIRQGPVLFYSAEENMKVLHQRVARICIAEGIELNRLGDLHFADLSQLVDASLITGSNRNGTITTTLLYKRLDMLLTILKPVCVWLDNRGLLVTGNENDRTIAASAMRAFQLLAAKHKCAIIMIAHPSKSGESDGSGSSGSTAWFATGRSVLFMEKPQDAEKGQRVLTNTMSNYSEGGTVVSLQWEFDRFKCTDKPQAADTDVGRHDKAERVFLKLLRWYTSIDQEVSPNPKSGNTFAPKLFSANDQCEKVTPKLFRQAMEALLARKAIRVETRGKSTTPVKYLVEV